MKTLLFICFSLFTFSLSLFAQQDTLGFTNKAEARNILKDTIKEGKWVEYIDRNLHDTKDTNASIYRLSVYKSGRPYGMVRYYYKLRIKTPN
jgi:hypothetical protein